MRPVARNTLNGGTQKYTLTATSTNGGRSWTSFALDTNVPGYDSKVYFTKNSTGRYLTIYNTADEYAPGKFFVVWEHDTSRIKVNELDVSDT